MDGIGILMMLLSMYMSFGSLNRSRYPTGTHPVPTTQYSQGTVPIWTRIQILYMVDETSGRRKENASTRPIAVVADSEQNTVLLSVLSAPFFPQTLYFFIFSSIVLSLN